MSRLARAGHSGPTLQNRYVRITTRGPIYRCEEAVARASEAATPRQVRCRRRSGVPVGPGFKEGLLIDLMRAARAPRYADWRARQPAPLDLVLAA